MSWSVWFFQFKLSSWIKKTLPNYWKCNRNSDATCYWWHWYCDDDVWLLEKVLGGNKARVSWCVIQFCRVLCSPEKVSTYIWSHLENFYQYLIIFRKFLIKFYHIQKISTYWSYLENIFLHLIMFKILLPFDHVQKSP